MSGLDLWLKQATRHLSRDSAARVRAEIGGHFESAREAAIGRGATAAQGDETALIALGDAKTANKQYRKVLLTSSEARLLREGNWEAGVVCSNARMRTGLLSIPGIVMLAAGAFFLRGASEIGWVLLVGGIGMSLLFLAPFLPVYTPARSRVVRYVRWVVLAGITMYAFGPEALKYSWLLFASLWPMAWIEWRRSSIRRKLPVAKWPKHLYL